MTSHILVDRTHIGIFGRTNAGKSTIMNLLVNQPKSIVDEYPGTTTDVVQAVMEIHGFGPVKIFDTAGLDEYSELGEKKKNKTLQVLKECDLVLLVVALPSSSETLSEENEVIMLCKKYEKQLLIVFNVFRNKTTASAERLQLNSARVPEIVVDAHEAGADGKLISFAMKHYVKKIRVPELIPFMRPHSFVAMNIPVDDETPEGRLLRPQNVVLDFLLRRTVPFAGYRMDLTRARSTIASVREEEKRLYLNFLNELDGQHNGLQLVITDSQAIDIVDSWTPDHIPLTTFSIIMINSQSNGNLARFVDGLNVLPTLQEGDRVAIAEACTHNRTCGDIGTVQIPQRLQKALSRNLEFDFIFGRDFASEKELKKYKLVIHCGGCMIDSQNVHARMDDVFNLNTPMTNYGLLLSFINSPRTLSRVLRPWSG